MTMNANTLISCIGSSLQAFFGFCETRNAAMKASELDALFAEYFEIEGGVKATTSEAKAKTKTPKTKASGRAKAKNAPKSPHTFSSSDEGSDDETRDEMPTIKQTPASLKAVKPSKPPIRKASGKAAALAREDQTVIGNIDKKVLIANFKLPDLKIYCKERGLPVSGNKAQLVDYIVDYELTFNMDPNVVDTQDPTQTPEAPPAVETGAEAPEAPETDSGSEYAESDGDAKDAYDYSDDEEDKLDQAEGGLLTKPLLTKPISIFDDEDDDYTIGIKKPVNKEKLTAPAKKKKYTIQQLFNLNLVHHSGLDYLFVLNKDQVVNGLVYNEEILARPEVEPDVYQLEKVHCKKAKELGLKFEVPDNLDA